MSDGAYLYLLGIVTWMAMRPLLVLIVTQFLFWWTRR